MKKKAWGRVPAPDGSVSRYAAPGGQGESCIRPARAEASDGEQLDRQRGRAGVVGLGVGLGCSIVDHMGSSTHDELGMWAGFVL